MRNLLLATLLLSIPFVVTAQRYAAPDYVVTTAGDTLRGQLRQVGRHDEKLRLFRPGLPAADFGPTDATSFGSLQGGPEGISRPVGQPGQLQFLKPLVDGPVQLLMGDNEPEQPRYFLQLPGAQALVEVAAAGNTLTLARALPGCPALDFGTPAFEARYPYSRRGLSDLVHDYNHCRQPEQPSRVLPPKRLQVTVGVKGGITRLLVRPFPDAFIQPAHDVLGFQGGIMVQAASRTRLSAQAELLYTTQRSTFENVEFNANNTNSPANLASVTIRYEQLQLPLLLRYTLGHGVVRPFITSGVFLAGTLHNSSAVHYPNSPSTGDQFFTIGASTTYGVAVGSGIVLYHAWRPCFSLEARYLASSSQALLGERNAAIQLSAGFYL